MYLQILYLADNMPWSITTSWNSDITNLSWCCCDVQAKKQNKKKNLNKIKYRNKASASG